MMLDKVFVVIEQFTHANPECGLSNMDYLIVQSLKNSGLARTIEIFYYDILSQQFGQSTMGELLLERCGKEQPNLVIVSPGGWFNLDPPRSAISMIVETLGIKVVLVRSDSGGEEGGKWTNSWFPFVNFVMVIDVAIKHIGYGQQPKVIQGFTCHAGCFYPGEQKRDIDISFVGTIADCPRRAEYINFLREHGINIVTRGGQILDLIPQDEYADIIRQSKISLNFCLHTGEVYPQVKGRVFEITACNTLLIEDEGTETKEFFTEGKDFIMVRSKEEMLEKVRYYLEHDEERERIATSGYRKTTALYNGRNLWGYAFKKMGFDIPESLVDDRQFQRACRKLDSL